LLIFLLAAGDRGEEKHRKTAEGEKKWGDDRFYFRGRGREEKKKREKDLSAARNALGGRWRRREKK